MKTLKQLIIAIFIASASFGTTMAGGNSVGQRVESPSALKERVESLIHVPSPAEGSISGEVEMLIRINDAGYLELLKIDGDHDYMVDQVREDVEDQRINASENIQGKVFRLVLHYANTNN